MSNKTPYELRMDMIKLAYDHLDAVQEVSNKFALEAFKLAVEQGKTTWSEWEKFTPKGFTFQEVVQKAEELYGFVSKKEAK